MINDISENKIIESFYNLIPYLEYFMKCDLGFTISNTERFLFTQYNDSFKRDTSNLDRMPKIGDKIPAGSAADVCLREKRVVYVDVPEKVFGIPVCTVAVPVFNDNKTEIEGTMVMAINANRQRRILNLANSAFESLSTMSTNTSEMTARFEEISSTNVGIESFINGTAVKAKKTDEILRFVNSITHKINLLGLNASIESARAGEAGRGFSVVAQEISKLSQSTKQSVDEINSVLVEIKGNINEIGYKINNSNELLEAQIGELTSISENITSINATIKELLEDSRKL